MSMKRVATRATRRSRTRATPPLVVRELPIDVYGRIVTLLYGSVDDANRYYARLYKRLDREYGASWATESERRPIRARTRGQHSCILIGDSYERDFIFIRRDPGNRDGEASCLAHECLHHASYAMRAKGIPLSDDTEEAYTYYLQSIMRRCLYYMR